MEVAPLYVAMLRSLDMGYRNIVNVIDITATGTISTTGAISSNSLTTHTLTTSGAALNIKSDLVLFKRLDNSTYMDAHPGDSDVYIDATLKIQNGFSIDAQTGLSTWTETMGVVGSTGNISTNATITAVGHINGKTG